MQPVQQADILNGLAAYVKNISKSQHTIDVIKTNLSNVEVHVTKSDKEHIPHYNVSQNEVGATIRRVFNTKKPEHTFTTNGFQQTMSQVNSIAPPIALLQENTGEATITHCYEPSIIHVDTKKNIITVGRTNKSILRGIINKEKITQIKTIYPEQPTPTNRITRELKRKKKPSQALINEIEAHIKKLPLQ